MVRRAAAQCLGPLAEVADAHTLSSAVAPTFLKLTQDGVFPCVYVCLVHIMPVESLRAGTVLVAA